MRDLKSNITTTLALSPAVYSATKADAPIIDLQGADAATLIINTGAIVGAGDYTPSLLMSDLSDMSVATTAAADDLIGAFPASLAADSSYAIGFRGEKRYVRLVLTKNSGTSIAVGASVVKSKLSLAGKA